MIQVEGLSIAYHGVPLFENATFSLQPGERCGFVGRNGSGKTTLFKLLTEEETPDAGTISTRKNYVIGALSQHIKFTQPTLLDEAATGLREEEKECLYKAEKILFGLGFKEDDLAKNPKDFSGGYQLRLHLAKVLIAEPNCLLLDEPTNYLDIVSIRWFTRFLKQWQGEFILITHDREFMDSVTTHTMGIQRQKVLKVQGSTVDFYEKILLDEEIHERTRINLDKKRAHTQAFIDRFGAKATKAAQAQSRRKQLERIPVLEKLKELRHLDFHFNEAPFYSQKMLEADSLFYSYIPDSPLIQNVSLTIEAGERIAILGKNGRGKSTILRLLAQELTPLSGSIKCSDNVRIGYFGQTNIDRLHPKHTIEEEIAAVNPKLSRTEVKGICGLMMFSGAQAEKTTSVLSGGERSRVLLGKILAKPCNLLLLDEPTHHLDMESIEALIDSLEDFEGAVVIVTHSELILKRLALDKIVVCHEGAQKFFLGNYEDFLDTDGWHDQEEAVKPKKTSPPPVPKQRTEEMAARSKALKSLDQEIAKCETLITKLEKEQDQAHQQLVTCTEKRESQAIQLLAKDIAARGKALEQSYEQLEALTSKRELLKATK